MARRASGRGRAPGNGRRSSRGTWRHRSTWSWSAPSPPAGRSRPRASDRSPGRAGPGAPRSPARYPARCSPEGGWTVAEIAAVPGERLAGGGRARRRDRRPAPLRYTAGIPPPARSCRTPAPQEVTVPVADDTRIAVIGRGYVGLPLAIAFAEAGLDVLGIDASPRRVEELTARHSPIDDIGDARLSAALDGNLRVALGAD